MVQLPPIIISQKHICFPFYYDSNIALPEYVIKIEYCYVFLVFNTWASLVKILALPQYLLDIFIDFIWMQYFSTLSNGTIILGHLTNFLFWKDLWSNYFITSSQIKSS